MPILRKLDPVQTPATTRVVVIDKRQSPDLVFEVVVIEWLPSGSAVHLRYPERNNLTVWTEDLFNGAILETIP